MTNYELQLRHINRFPERTEILLQTKHLLMYEVDNEIVYVHEFDDDGKCTSANWFKANH
jgi:hypothetical protein